MFNPNMVNMGMGQLPDLPSQSELWKNEKSKYRHWIILFGVGILALFALYLSSFIWNLVDGTHIKGLIYERIYDSVKDLGIYKDPQTVASESADRWFIQNIVVFPSLMLFALTISLLLYYSSVFQSYKAKSFAKLSSLPGLLIAFGGLIALWQLFSLIWRDRFEFDFSGGVYLFISYFLVIILWIGVSQPIARIRRSFLLSARVEVLKKSSAQFSNLQQDGNNNAVQNGFGPFMTPSSNAVNNGNQVAPDGAKLDIAKSNAASKEQAERAKLVALSFEDLRKIAKKLSISGYETMDKNELIANILRVYSK